MRWAIVSSQVDHEAFSHAVTEATRLIQLPHIEQVAWMLSVQGGNQFAGVQFITSEDRCFELDTEQIAGSRTQRPMFNRQYCASENNVHFDFDLAGVILDDQLGVTQILAANQACLYRSEEHTSELQSLMRISYPVFCLQNNKQHYNPLR